MLSRHANEIRYFVRERNLLQDGFGLEVPTLYIPTRVWYKLHIKYTIYLKETSLPERKVLLHLVSNDQQRMVQLLVDLPEALWLQYN
jgi:hypothetical protein